MGSKSNNDKQIGEMETTGWSEWLDVSPDGSLVLTGNSERRGFEPYKRLDVWAPMLKRHAVGWEAFFSDPYYDRSHPTWATFTDKRHVLTRSEVNLVLWELPACKAVYTIPQFGRFLALNPNRKYVVGITQNRGLQIYETSTGKCVGNLEKPQSTAGYLSFPKAWFRPDGQALAMFFSDGMTYTGVVLYDMTTGKIQSQFAIPSNMSFANVSWIDSKHLFLHGRFVLGKDYLLDLENRALVCQYDDGVECTLHETGRLDGTMWLETRNSRLAANNFKLRDFTFPLPSNPPRLEDHASLHPGEGVSVSVASSVIDQAILYAEVTQTLRERGFKVDRKASRRFRLSVEPKTIREARLNSGRTFSVQTFVFHWTFFDAAGVKIWEQLSPMPWTSYVVGNSAVSNEQEAQEKMKEQFRKTARTMTMPRYVFPKVEALNLPVRKYSE